MAAGRSVVFRFLSDTTSLKKGFADAGKGAHDAEGVFARLEGKLTGVSAGALGAAAGITGVTTSIVGFATMAIHRLGEEQVAAAQTGAAILSTGGAAKVTAGHVGTLAEELAKVSGVDDEVVRSGENLLLTFTNIRNGVGAGNDVFDQATKAALDMSVALGEDLHAASMQVGKALQDPIAGVTALRRVGVLLTDQQKASISAFVASGDVMSAQKVILAELTKEFGGHAEAYGTTIPGAIGKARTAFENFSADMATKATPAVKMFGRVVADLATKAGPAFSATGQVLSSVLVPAVVAAGLALAAMGWGLVASKVGGVITSVKALAVEMGTLRLALASVAWGVAIAGLSGFATGMFNAKRAADALAESIKAGYDLSSQQGLHDALAETDAQLASATTRLQGYHNPVKAFFTNIVQSIGPGENALQNAAADVASLAAQHELLAVQSAHFDENVSVAGEHLKMTTGQVIALAKATGIDLTGGLGQTTEALYAADAAQKVAASGWGVYRQSAEEAIAVQVELVKTFEAAIDPVKVYGTALAAANDATKSQSKVAADSVREQAKATRDQLDARHDAEKAALAGEFITGKASQAAHDQRIKNLDAQQKVENDAADATVTSEGKRADAIENTKVRTTLSMAEYQKSVAANTKATLARMHNLAVIASRGGGDFIDVLAQLPPEAAGLIAEIASASKPKFDAFAQTMREGSKTAVDAASEEFRKVPDSLAVIGTLGGEAMATAIRTALQKNKITVDDVISEEIKLLLGVGGKSYNDLVAAGRVAGPASPVRATPTPVPAPVVRGISGPGGLHAAEGHYAQVAPAGAWRIWAEPETGGEAYIPLAASKRAGSLAIFSQVARAFGQAVVPMAVGGTWGVPAGGGASGGGAQLGSAVAALERAVGALQAGGRRGPTNVQNVFNEKVDPLHVSRKILWELTG